MVRLTVVGPACSMCCTILSAFGIVFLLMMGALFNTENPSLADHNNPPADLRVVAKGCYLAGFIYMAFFVFCWCQSYLNQRQAAQERGFSNI
ncbi:hypothetical protein DFS34DRAFT_426139 [Phlyctochytrium arcticum]|nr:hypothetical protein DFS34DRAFT_426139 [Phlyctochytrium arcticum]